MLLVTCIRLFSGCCLAVHWGQADLGEHASPLEALQAADEGSKCLVSPANIGDLHSSPSQREQQTIAHCHRRSLQAIYQIKRALNSTLKVWMRKQLSLNRKLLTNWKGSGQALKKSLEVKVGVGHPADSGGHLFPCPCPLVIQAEWDYSAPHRRSPHNQYHMVQDCDCNGPLIPGGPGPWTHTSGGSGLSL